MDTHERQMTDVNPPEKMPVFKTIILSFSLVLPLIGMALTYFYSIYTFQYWLGIALVASMGMAAIYASRTNHLRFFEDIVLVLAFMLSLIGIGLTDFSASSSFRFWVAMTVFMAAAAIIIGTVRYVEGEDTGFDVIFAQFFHWGATLLTVVGIFLLLKAGRLNYENSGLVLPLIIGLATFLDGYRISWRFSLIGVMISVTAIIAAFVEQFIWPVLFVAILVATIAVFWEKISGRGD